MTSKAHLTSLPPLIRERPTSVRRVPTPSDLARVRGKVLTFSPVVGLASGVQKVLVPFPDAGGRILPSVAAKRLIG